MTLQCSYEEICWNSLDYLGAFAPLPLAVGQEAAEEGQVDAVVEGQQEVTGQLEAGGVLRPQLPHTVQEEQENWSLVKGEKRIRYPKRFYSLKY